ncbi:unnamed protein product [Chrysoparadoxa australica]
MKGAKSFLLLAFVLLALNRCAHGSQKYTVGWVRGLNARIRRSKGVKGATTAMPCRLSKIIASIIGASTLIGGPAIVHASKFDPRPPPVQSRRPYFIGYFIRATDYESNGSFCVIIGSFCGAGVSENSYNSHYVSVSYLDDCGKLCTVDAFPPKEKVSITSHGIPMADAPTPDGKSDPCFCWESEGLGRLEVGPSGGQFRFKFPEVELLARYTGRLPWSLERPNSAGPEGWLAKTGLLPTHYFVHSFNSDVWYQLSVQDRNPCHGRGSLHMESNYGDVFPEGWIWSQGCSASIGKEGALCGAIADRDRSQATMNQGDKHMGQAHYVFTGGKFVIGPIVTNTWLIGYRSDKIQWDFRTTDGDSIQRSCVSYDDGHVSLVATSRDGSRIMEVEVKAPKASFGEPIYVPSISGWTNEPGCVESHTATATFRCYSKRLGRGKGIVHLIEEVVMPLAILEFGGDMYSSVTRGRSHGGATGVSPLSTRTNS